MIETDSLLVKCPNCGAWPMAASLPRSGAARQEVRFRCPECRRQETGHLRATGRPLRLSQPSAQVRGG